MNNLTINVYDKKGKAIVKTCSASTFDIMFGTVQKLMCLLKVEELTDQRELIKIVYDAWEEIRALLDEVFPDMTEDDWNHVKVKELVPVIIGIVKATVADFMSIPVDPKN